MIDFQIFEILAKTLPKSHTLIYFSIKLEYLNVDF